MKFDRYDDYAKNKDVQMLAMLSVLMLQTPYAEMSVRPPPVQPSHLQRPSINVLPSSVRNARSNSSTSYFSVVQGLNQQQHPTSPITPAPLAPSLSSSTSSRNSWASSIFGAGRQFVQETFHPTLATHTDVDRGSTSPSSEKLKALETLVGGGSGNFRRRKDSHKTMTSQSWTEKTPVPQPLKTSVSSGASALTVGGGVSFSSASGQSGGSGKRMLQNMRWTNSNQSGLSAFSAVSEKQFVMFEAPEDEK
jgi:hypothetical protein